MDRLLYSNKVPCVTVGSYHHFLSFRMESVSDFIVFACVINSCNVFKVHIVICFQCVVDAIFGLIIACCFQYFTLRAVFVSPEVYVLAEKI